ncbi:uncharacterized protein [Dermacentor albipictus]|uniref:uncharacterized protein isoform X1 n=1 Tax=Dermacentor albipictus TaxID=60249 RepID=UPI0031FDCD3A
MNVALVAGLVLTSLLAGCEAQGTKGQGMVFPPSPGTKGGGYFPDGGGYGGGGFGGGFGVGAKGGMKGGGLKGFPPQQPQFQGKDGAAKRAKRSLLPYTEILSGKTPDFVDLGRDVKPEERIPAVTNSSDDYEEALMKPVKLGPLRQHSRKPWGQGRPTSRPQQ